MSPSGIVWSCAFATEVIGYDGISLEQGECRLMSSFAGLSEAGTKTAYKPAPVSALPRSTNTLVIVSFDEGASDSPL